MKLCRVCTVICDGPYCPKHKGNNPRANKRPDPFYVSTPWKHLQKYMAVRNPICQRILNGIQCMNPSIICHHFRGIHTAPQLRLDPRNLAMLCRGCHPDYETPEWKVGVDYVPTNT